MRALLFAPFAAACLVLAITVPARAEPLPPGASVLAGLSDRYFAEEDLWNGLYVGAGAANIAAGTALATRGDAGLRAAGVPAVIFGGVQLAVGVAYLALTRGYRSTLRLGLARDPEAALRDEIARMRRVESGFRYYKIAEGVIGSLGLALAVAGAASRRDAMTGAGVGLGVSACLQLVFEHSTHDVAKAYLRALERLGVEGGRAR